jgi:hypothetical protein
MAQQENARAPRRAAPGRPFTLALALALAWALAAPLPACGKRGSPEPPPGEKSDFPRTYPHPSTY